jgi:hypothetical protein
MGMNVLPGNIPLVELIRNYIRVLNYIFSISSLVKISMTSLSRLSMLNELQTAKMAGLKKLLSLNLKNRKRKNNEITYWNIKLQKDFLVYCNVYCNFLDFRFSSVCLHFCCSVSELSLTLNFEVVFVHVIKRKLQGGLKIWLFILSKKCGVRSGMRGK